AVNLVVEEHDLQIHVAADGVNQVIAADRQSVAVAGDDPDVQIGAGEPNAGGKRRRPAVNAVETIGVHVVGEPARTADAGYEHELLARNAGPLHDFFHLREDRVIAATRAPANLLIAGQVFRRQGGQTGGWHFYLSSFRF